MQVKNHTGESPVNNGLLIKNNEVHFSVAWLENNIGQEELKKQLFEAYIIREYEQDRLSLGEIAEIIEATTPETMKWLNNKGVQYRVNADIERETDKTMNNILSNLKK